MKKTIFSLVALLSLALTSMGQSAPEGRGGHFDKHKMAKERTERMVKEYKLNKTQAAQLLQLNEEFAQSFPIPRPGGPRHGMKKPQADGTTGATRQAPPQKPDSATIMPAPPAHDKKAVRMSPQQVRKQKEAYDARIKQIFTKKQYKKYLAAQEKHRGPHHDRK